MEKMNLKLGKTYYKKGFFNIKSSISKRYINNSFGECSFRIGEIIFFSNYYTANLQGQIRIKSSMELLSFFQTNFNLNDEIEIMFLSFEINCKIKCHP